MAVESDFIQLLHDFKEACRRHDWYYQYSDDHRVWQKGSKQSANISAMFKELKEHGLGTEADKIYDEHRPRNF